MKVEPDFHQHVDAVEHGAARISSLARAGDLGIPVDHLNRWKVRDVVAHLGGVHAWATRILVERSMDVGGSPKSTLDGGELCDWFDAGAEQLVATLRSLDASEPCPNFNPGSERLVSWWARRQAHETTVHRWDVERPYDTITPIDHGLATDGVDEFLDVFVRTRGKQTLKSTFVLETTGTKRAWTLSPAANPGRIDVAQGPLMAGEAVAKVIGSPEAMLLALWGRLSIADAELTVQGDPNTAQAMFTL